MSIETQPDLQLVADAEEIVYPDSDGQPMADNTKQFRWIVTIAGGLDALFRERPDVFVAGDLLWYPVEGQPNIRIAPDAMVVFGRPKGDRGSYRQWVEEQIAPQVVFEVLSPGNRFAEMVRKLRFYERYGVEEYYIYDPDHGELTGWLRAGEALEEIEAMRGWVSPRLGIRFELERRELQLYRPDGRRFASYVELEQQREQEYARAEQAQQQAALERQQREQAQQQAALERQQREQAQQQAALERQQREQAQQQATEAQSRAERLAAQLRALGIDPGLDA